MDRAWKSGASATPPTAPTTFSSGYPTEGEPGTGTPATKPGAFWYHAITEELRSIIVAGGLVPSATALNQVKAALDVMYASLASFTGSNQSLATAAGYQKFPGGLILQWGVTGSVANGAVVGATFPVAFPNAAAVVFVQSSSNGSVGNYAQGVGAFTRTSFSTVSTNNVTSTFYWIAIGF